MLLLPTEKIEQYDSVELTDLDDNPFQFNYRNLYEHKSIFFKDRGFNRTDEAWDSNRHNGNFFSVAQGKKSVFLIYDLRSNLQYAKDCISKGVCVREAQETIEYCEDLISRGHAYVIVDGQNRETNNTKWYEGDLPNTAQYGFKSFHSYVNQTDIIKVDEDSLPTKNGSRDVYYIHPNAKQIRLDKWKSILSDCGGDKVKAKKLYKRQGKTYTYEYPAPKDFVESYDNQDVSVHLVTNAFYSQIEGLYWRYNNQDQNKPVELRNAIQGKLSNYKKSLMWNGEEDNFTTMASNQFKKYLHDFTIKGVVPRDAYYNDMISDGGENRMGGFLLSEEEFTFLDNDSLLESADDDTFRDILSKYYHKLPDWIEIHKSLVRFRANCFTSYNHRQAKFKMKRKNALDYFIFGYDLQNPMDMFEELNFSPLSLVPDSVVDKMTDKEKDDFSVNPIEVMDYTELSKWICDEVLIKEYDEKLDDEDKWNTETSYFNRLGSNKHWKLRRILFRKRFLEDIGDLLERGVIRITQKKRVISDKDFRKLARQNNMLDSNGNKINSFEELFKVYAKAHGEPFSFGINKGGVTTKSNTDIDTKIDNQKLGAKSKYV